LLIDQIILFVGLYGQRILVVGYKNVVLVMAGQEEIYNVDITTIIHGVIKVGVFSLYYNVS